ncbi:MAG: aspartyl-tRNA(Asn)/glutamyl-tRNA(Gln) amidotransferase subunit, partial [Rhodocyclaceae bacterium]|nr:aspartyl-tRNA(Asn)/glutamyl-tRNA(Gln) amidotransferase subunit [Rhodocyclaceae bacterium]
VLFDPDTGETRMMRSKEDAHDYRYFPDPDLLPLMISPEWKARVQAEMPELPGAMKARFMDAWGLSAYDATTLTASKEVADFYQATVSAAGAAPATQLPKLCANWVMGDLAARLNKAELDVSASPVSPAQLAGLVARIADNTISNAIGKKVFEALWNGEGATADEVIDRQGLKQVTDSGAIEAMIDAVLAANQKSVDEFRAGKDKAFNALVGQVMKASKGKASPAQVNELLKKKLGA